MKAVKTQVVKLKLSGGMMRYFDSLCDYRRYIWNQALDTWQKMYAARIIMLPDVLKQKLKGRNVSLTSDEKALLKQVPSPCWQAVKSCLPTRPTGKLTVPRESLP